MVNGQEQKHTEGAYYIEWREGGQRKRESVGKDAAQANARRLRKEAELNAVSQGLEVAESPDGIDPKKHLVQTTIADFIEETRLIKKKKTH
jgi:hypothetical protein